MGIFGNTLSGWHLLIVLFVIILLFGAAKLPALAQSVGQSMKILRRESRDAKTGEPGDGETDPTIDVSAPRAQSDRVIDQSRAGSASE